MVRKYLFLLLALTSLIVAPALALTGTTNTGDTVDNVEYVLVSAAEELNYYDIAGPIVFNQAADGYIISDFRIGVDPNQAGTFSVHLNDGGTVITGSFDYDVDYFGFVENFYISLDSANTTFGGLAPVFRTKEIIISFVVADAGTENETYYIGMTREDLSNLYANNMLLYPVSSPSDNPIVQIDITPESEISQLKIYVTSWEELAKAESNSTVVLISWITGIFWSFWDILLLLWGIFSFFFIENLLLMILIIEGTILAYRFNTSKNVFLALSRTASDNQRLLTGIISFVQMAVGFVWDVVNLLNPLRWVFGK
jgi:hypothetical protein